MKILEIGPGTADASSALFPGADTLDGEGTSPTYRANWGAEPLPIPDDTYDLVFASHVLEHLPWYRTVTALREIARILKPGGEIEIYVPDFAYIVQCYQQKKCGDNWRVFNRAGDFMTWVNGRLFTYGPDATELKSAARPITQSHHKTVFDQPYLLQRLRESGFVDCTALTRRRHGKAHSIKEVGAIGRKPNL
jgi:SAM-dependent methyltransferase